MNEEEIHFGKLLLGNSFGTFDTSDIDLWPSDPKMN